MNRSKRGTGRWVLALVGAASVAGWALLRGDERGGSELLLNRVWVDHLPSGGNDAVELFVAIDDESMGAFQRASQYEGEWALFRHEARGDSILRLTFPQRGSTHDVRYHAKACDEPGWDYCLTLEGAPRGVTQYHSRRGWEVDAEKGRSPAAALEAFRRATR
ncbi:MAG TPA: hypothetical protein VFS43_37390 [Polyangiaceae bacterium]|nr:hypothetical protein [Polyangiaceae bacterium]